MAWPNSLRCDIDVADKLLAQAESYFGVDNDRRFIFVSAHCKIGKYRLLAANSAQFTFDYGYIGVFAKLFGNTDRTYFLFI